MFKRLKYILRHPSAEWLLISTEKDSLKKFGKIFFTIILIGTSVQFAGNYLYVFPSDLNRSFENIIDYPVTAVVSLFFTILLTRIIAKSFQAKNSVELIILLIGYSTLPFFISTIPGNFKYSLSFIKVIGLFSVYLLWEGAPLIIDLPEENKLNFVFVVSLLFIGCYSIINSIMY